MEQSPNTSPRRRFFKLAALSTAAAGLAGLGLGVFARGRHHGGEGMSEEHLDRMLKHMYVEIDATDAQKQQLEPIVKQAAADLKPLRAKARDARKRGAELLSADTIDRGAIERARAEGISVADASSRRFTQALTDVAEVLTPAQRKKLAARFAHRGGRGRFSS
jgi:Spy/CpxP family protein refolding chaperone